MTGSNEKKIAATEVNTENAVNEQKPVEVPLIGSYRKDDKNVNNVCVQMYIECNST